MFLINVPVGLAAFAGARRLLPAAGARHDAEKRGGGSRGALDLRGLDLRGLDLRGLDLRGLDLRGLDLRGAVLAVAGVVGVVYAISEGPRYGWGSARTLAPFLLAAVLLAAFWLTERRAASPLLPPGTLRSRSLASVLVMLAATGLLVGQQLVTSLFLQDVIGASPLRAGVEFLPLMLATVLGAAAASHLAGHAGTRLLATAGLSLLAAGDLLLSRATADGYLAVLLPGMILSGIGCGLTFPAAAMTALSKVRDGMEGLASGLVTTGHEVGAGIGAAVFPALATAAAAVPHGASLSAGYQHALTVAAIAAAAIAALAAAVLPSARPTPGARVGFH